MKNNRGVRSCVKTISLAFAGLQIQRSMDCEIRGFFWLERGLKAELSQDYKSNEACRRFNLDKDFTFADVTHVFTAGIGIIIIKVQPEEAFAVLIVKDRFAL